ncbi:hypothetical protein BD289DRAFT_166468 [Coniella lustricola]|uniref:Uncharacterized protein n=1 Tax=Coniella lustricola TaxID=2025994 RepID=A0A2T3AE56_9PEZI|nr:hypothetical protein BD289DRAFT_166468 [Coniella lustricola]
MPEVVGVRAFEKTCVKARACADKWFRLEVQKVFWVDSWRVSRKGAGGTVSTVSTVPMPMPMSVSVGRIETWQQQSTRATSYLPGLLLHKKGGPMLFCSFPAVPELLCIVLPNGGCKLPFQIQIQRHGSLKLSVLKSYSTACASTGKAKQGGRARERTNQEA